MVEFEPKRFESSMVSVLPGLGMNVTRGTLPTCKGGRGPQQCQHTPGQSRLTGRGHWRVARSHRRNATGRLRRGAPVQLRGLKADGARTPLGSEPESASPPQVRIMMMPTVTPALQCPRHGRRLWHVHWHRSGANRAESRSWRVGLFRGVPWGSSKLRVAKYRIAKCCQCACVCVCVSLCVCVCVCVCRCVCVCVCVAVVVVGPHWGCVCLG